MNKNSVIVVALHTHTHTHGYSLVDKRGGVDKC